MYEALKVLAFNIRFLIDTREFSLIPKDLILPIIDKSFEYYVGDINFDSRFLIEKMMSIGGYSSVFDLLNRSKQIALDEANR
jgi:hypothetical protein